MNCKDFIALLSDYLEATVTPETLAALRQHMHLNDPARGMSPLLRSERPCRRSCPRR